MLATPVAMARPRFLQFRPRALLAAFFVVGALLIGARWLFLWGFLGVGPVWTRSSWPDELQRIADRLPVDELNGIKIYCLGEFIDSEHVWRASAPRSTLETLQKELQLEAIDRKDVPNRFWSKPPWWWNPDQNAAGEFFATPGFSADTRGNDGTYAFVMYDRKNELIYVWSNTAVRLTPVLLSRTVTY